MNKKYFFIVIALILISLCFFVSAKPKWSTCPIKSDTNIAFYGDTTGGGVGTPSRSWVIHFLDWWKTQDSSIKYVELDSIDVKRDCDLESFSNLKLYIQPGGYSYDMQRALDDSGKQNILRHINSGKGYAGFCAGWYYTANDYYWEGSYYDWSDMLDYYPATVEGSIWDIATYPDHAMTSLDTGFNAIYYGGPTIGWKDTSGNIPGVVEATFSSIEGDLPAIVKYNGNALLTSVHLEAYENDGITGLSTEDRLENYKYLANLLNEVSGTSYIVPAYANPPVCGNNIKETGEVCDGGDLDGETCGSLGFDDGNLSCLSDCSGFEILGCVNYPPECSDGIDNDGDNLTDYLSDPGCDSYEDDDERDYTGPVEIFNDNFESGNLGQWNTYGTGRPWQASTDTAHEGSWSARAKKTGAGKDSFMEVTFDASTYNEVTFEYYRRLVGLDAADDFEVEYFDGSWHSLEHLGTARASDSSFKFKTFSIPSTTSKIRFKCECGAVSEKCYVDNVRVVAQ